MTNKTLGSWAVGCTAGLFLLFFGGMPDTNPGLWSLFAIVYFVFTVWAGIRLMKS